MFLFLVLQSPLLKGFLNILKTRDRTPWMGDQTIKVLYNVSLCRLGAAVSFQHRSTTQYSS